MPLLLPLLYFELLTLFLTNMDLLTEIETELELSPQDALKVYYFMDRKLKEAFTTAQQSVNLNP